MTTIDYDLLGRAVKMYEGLGYTQVEVPWWVSREVIMATAPDEDCIFSLGGDRDLIGSAEQGFLAIWDTLSVGHPYMAVSPCFRAGDVKPPYNQETFMKLELIIRCGDRYLESHFRTITFDAKTVFGLLGSRVATDRVGRHDDDDVQWDYTHNGVEIGSYGVRKFRGEYYVYGTGIALPRFSQSFRFDRAVVDSIISAFSHDFEVLDTQAFNAKFDDAIVDPHLANTLNHEPYEGTVMGYYSEALDVVANALVGRNWPTYRDVDQKDFIKAMNDTGIVRVIPPMIP